MKSKLYELSKSVTKTNNKRDVLVLWFSSETDKKKKKKKQLKSECALYFANHCNLFIQPLETKWRYYPTTYTIFWNQFEFF